MLDDELGEWTEMRYAGHDVKYRRRLARSSEVHFATKYIVDVSIDGKPPVSDSDLNSSDYPEQALQYFLDHLISQ